MSRLSFDATLVLSYLDDWHTRAALDGRDRSIGSRLDRCLPELEAAGVVERTETALGPMWRRRFRRAA